MPCEWDFNIDLNGSVEFVVHVVGNIAYLEVQDSVGNWLYVGL